MFICNHCPFVKHLKKDIVKLANFYMKVSRFLSIQWSAPFPFLLRLELRKWFYKCNKHIMLQKGLAVVAISSNSVATHPQVPYQGLLLSFILPLGILDKRIELCESWSMIDWAGIYRRRMDQSSWRKKLKLSVTPSPTFMMRYAAWHRYSFVCSYVNCIIYRKASSSGKRIDCLFCTRSYVTLVCSHKMLPAILVPFVHQSSFYSRRSLSLSRSVHYQYHCIKSAPSRSTVITQAWSHCCNYLWIAPD